VFDVDPKLCLRHKRRTDWGRMGTTWRRKCLDV